MATPRKSSKTPTATVGDEGTPTPRKRPHCRKCGKPMKCHDRNLCARLSTHPPDENDTELTQKPFDLLTKLSALHLEKDEDQDEKEAETRTSSRRRSLVPVKKEYCPSLSESQAAALDHLGSPGMMRDTICEEDKQYHAENIEKWSKNIVTEGCIAVNSGNPRTPRASLNRAQLSSDKPVLACLGKPEEDEFLTWLERKARLAVATWHTIDVDDIPLVETSAKRLKFFAKVLVPKYSEGKNKDALLVLGRDSNSVEELFKRIEEDVTSVGRKGSGTFSQLLVGGALGAIATWAVYAYY